MANQYVKKIADYLIKDEEARNDIASMKTNVNTIPTLTSKVNQQSETINSHTQSISSLNQSVNELKGKEHLALSYDADTETITFS